MINLGDVTVVSTRFLIVATVAASACWVLVLRRRLGRPRSTGSRLRARLAVVGAVLATLLVAADYVNSYFSYLPNVSDVADLLIASPPPPVSSITAVADEPRPMTGRLGVLAIPGGGPRSGFGRTEAWVWLPPQYFTEPTRRFPVLYLFHGSPGMPRDWFHGGQASRSAELLARSGHPVIEVAPQMSHDWLDDPECVDGIHEKVETHLLRQVIPTVDAGLRTIADRQGRIFAGMSAGGYCALNLGLRNRSVAATILDFSGDTGPTHTGGVAARFGPGTGAAQAAARNTPAQYAAGLRDVPVTRVWLDTGSADRGVLRQLTALATTLRARHFEVVMHTRPGSHTYSVWRPALGQSLRWALGVPSTG